VTIVLGMMGIDSLLVSWLVGCAWLFVEAMLLSACGTTMGKGLLGVTVRNADGSNLSFGAALGRAFAVMAATPRHTYQVLTKRPARMRSRGDAEFI
jgi:uncharacterized RDD family membrane protein YckC